ncbi:hypothetical protein L227DRAFT_368639 [Lentinus tigrinus ALCF2SS1-6]|uniref:Uncharacterized protein n=1 Tax=Lentinus tigrinus ALCF2SS1-6 TaxID=1328759 RepID=A0A5C2RT82_9APHY|nr:hypothetical protein L227DRAFT_368639 [Lentinus tigrinus ALCF2SS1-6]
MPWRHPSSSHFAVVLCTSTVPRSQPSVHRCPVIVVSPLSHRTTEPRTRSRFQDRSQAGIVARIHDDATHVPVPISVPIPIPVAASAENAIADPGRATSSRRLPTAIPRASRLDNHRRRLPSELILASRCRRHHQSRSSSLFFLLSSLFFELSALFALLSTFPFGSSHLLTQVTRADPRQAQGLLAPHNAPQASRPPALPDVPEHHAGSRDLGCVQYFLVRDSIGLGVDAATAAGGVAHRRGEARRMRSYGSLTCEYPGAGRHYVVLSVSTKTGWSPNKIVSSASPSRLSVRPGPLGLCRN